MISHKGEIVENAVRKMNFSITDLSKRLKLSRRHIYNLFENPNLPIEYILKIGKIIHYDFSEDIKDISKIPSEVKKELISENEVFYSDAEYWRNKYLEILEKHQRLLESKVTEYFKD